MLTLVQGNKSKWSKLSESAQMTKDTTDTQKEKNIKKIILNKNRINSSQIYTELPT